MSMLTSRGVKVEPMAKGLNTTCAPAAPLPRDVHRSPLLLAFGWCVKKRELLRRACNTLGTYLARTGVMLCGNVFQKGFLG